MNGYELSGHLAASGRRIRNSSSDRRSTGSEGIAPKRRAPVRPSPVSLNAAGKPCRRSLEPFPFRLKIGTGLWLLVLTRFLYANRSPLRWKTPWLRSGGADRGQEFGDFGPETAAIAGQRFRGREHLRGRRAGLGGAALHVGDVGGDLLGALRGLLHVAGDFLGGRTLLFHREAMVDEISDSFSMVPEISLIAFTDSCVAAWMPVIC